MICRAIRLTARHAVRKRELDLQPIFDFFREMSKTARPLDFPGAGPFVDSGQELPKRVKDAHVADQVHVRGHGGAGVDLAASEHVPSLLEFVHCRHQPFRAAPDDDVALGAERSAAVDDLNLRNIRSLDEQG